MSIGPAVRRRLGRFEEPLARLYRSIAVDVGGIGAAVAAVPPGPRMLEVGAGDGLVARAIIERTEETSILGIDLIDHPGRIAGDGHGRIEYRTIATDDLIAEGVEPFDTVLVSDVLHHVPVAERLGLLRSCVALLADGGMLVVKETIRRPLSPGYAWCVVSDRYVSGDRGVSFLSIAELDALVSDAAPGAVPTLRRVVRPWSINVVTAYRME